MADYVDIGLKRAGIPISKPMLAAVCIIFGIFLILFQDLLVWIVELFLVIQWALLLAAYFEQESRMTKITPPRSVFCSSCGARNPEVK